MAFQMPGNNSGNSNNQGNNENWKAQGFINIYLPGRGGKRRKLGSIALRDAKPAEKELIEFLKQDPENILALMAHAEIDFQLADDTENTGFDLGLVEAE